jgi:hypothetical protein
VAPRGVEVRRFADPGVKQDLWVGIHFIHTGVPPS